MKALIYIATFLFAFQSWSQELSATLNHSRILIGEQVEMTLKVKLKPRTYLRYEAFAGFVPGKIQQANSQLTTNQKVELEIVRDFYDTLIKGKDRDTWIGKYTITCWDSGTVVIPEQAITIGDSTLYFNELRLSCGMVPSVKNQDIFDIKESFAEVEEPQTRFYKFILTVGQNSYWLVPLLIILIIIFIQLRRHKKAAKPKRSEPEISLKDKTLIAIESLENRKLWNDGQLKLHYIELSYIMRSYLSSRYTISLLDKTTIETRLLLKQCGLHTETIDTLMTILNQSDMVKFAKSEPDEITILKVSILAKQIVAETSPIEFENVD